MSSTLVAVSPSNVLDERSDVVDQRWGVVGSRNEGMTLMPNYGVLPSGYIRYLTKYST